MSVKTPYTQNYITVSSNDKLANAVQQSLKPKKSLGSYAKGVVLAIVTDDPASGGADLRVGGLPIVTRTFQPSSAPFGYVVKIEEKVPLFSVTPTPNSEAYMSHVKAIAKEFIVLHGANVPVPNIGDEIVVGFKGPDFTGDGHLLQNLSFGTTALFAPAAGSVINYYGDGSEYAAILNSDSATPGIWGPLLDLISKYESGGDYEAIFGNFDRKNGFRPKPFSQMTINEVSAYGQKYYDTYKHLMNKNVRSAALGRYQQLHGTVPDRARVAGLDPAVDLFTPENQDKIAIAYNIEAARGGRAYLLNPDRENIFMFELSKEFASFPSADGTFRYTDQGKNGAKKVPEIKAVLRECRRRYLESQQSSDELQASGVTQTETPVN